MSPVSAVGAGIGNPPDAELRATGTLTLMKYLAVAFVLLGLAAVAEATDSPIAVYVTTPATSAGYTDPDKSQREALRYLTEAVSKRKNLRLVASREGAAIVLEVVGRESKALQVKLTAGDFNTVISGEADGVKFRMMPRNRWKEASQNIADQVDRWAVENRTKLTPVP